MKLDVAEGYSDLWAHSVFWLGWDENNRTLDEDLLEFVQICLPKIINIFVGYKTISNKLCRQK
jgi:hypothetical protein